MTTKGFTSKSELAQMYASRRQLDKVIEEKRLECLQTLHTEVELPTLDELVRALWPLATARLRAELSQRPPRATRSTAKTDGRGKRYDEATKARVRFALEEEHRAPASVRQEFALSMGTLKRWAAEWGIDLSSIHSINGMRPTGPTAGESNGAASTP